MSRRNTHFDNQSVDAAPVLSTEVRTVKVHTVTTGKTFGADEALMKQVETRMQLQVEKTNIEEAAVVVLFCPISSRVGSDVEAAMTQVSGIMKDVILVMLHHTRDVDYSTSVRNWSETYQQVVMDVDVLFHESTRGLLRCQRNKEAVCKIENWLWKHSTIDRASVVGDGRSGGQDDSGVGGVIVDDDRGCDDEDRDEKEQCYAS